MSSIVTEPEKKILDAAKKVFEEYGYSGARMQHIADEAGISKASLHYYFRSKENLFERIFDETMAEFMPVVSTWHKDEEDWERKLRGYIQEFFTFLRTKSLLFILREINRNPELLLVRRKNKPKAGFILYFEKLKAEKKIKDVDVITIYIFMQSMCSYPLLNTCMLQVTTGMSDKDFNAYLDRYPGQVADILINMLKITTKK